MSIYEDLPQGEYSLNKVDIREIVDKYPDKVVDIIDRERDVVIVLDTCKILLKKEKNNVKSFNGVHNRTNQFN
jgi:hypothetical protein|tara:strand:+ start:5283 stop:5501 length:219 start_codon:yes stop_codon:yes gene_type:complete